MGITNKKPGATLTKQTVSGTPQPEPIGSVLSTVIQWLFIFALIFGVIYLAKFLTSLPNFYLQHYETIALSFSSAFVWVYVFRWGSVKPFSCVTCMAGWFALIIGYFSVGWWAVGYMPVAMTVAALYSEIRDRWL